MPYAGDWWTNDLAFRDYLRANAETARAYEQLKRPLAPRFESANDYATPKTEFILAIKAGARAERGK